MSSTPGHWRVETGPEHTGRQVAELVSGTLGLGEYRIVHDGHEDGDAQSDAELIAAAPELLRLLRKRIEMTGGSKEELAIVSRFGAWE
jgi:hypothetical protein